MKKYNYKSKFFSAKFTRFGISIAEGLGIIFFAAGICTAFVVWAVKPIIHSRVKQTVPDIVGKPVITALDMLSEKNLALKKLGVEFDPSIPTGAVIRQVPTAGSVVREGKTVRIWLSRGGKVVFAPMLVGFPVRNAEMLIRKEQLTLGEIRETYSLAVEKGLIISQDPEANSFLTKNQTVNIVVSAGNPPEGIVLMPDFTQNNIENAKNWAAEKEVNLEILKDENSIFPDGTILAQNPEPDTILGNGLTASVTVSARELQTDETEKQHKITYKIPKTGRSAKIRIVIIDEQGEREIFNGIKNSGSKIELQTPYGGPAKIRIFINNVLVEEKVKN